MFIDCDDTLQIRARNVKVIANEQQAFVAGKDIQACAGEQVYVQADGVQAVAVKKSVVLQSPNDPSGRNF